MSVILSILIDRIFKYWYLLNINITETCTKLIKALNDEEFRVLKLKLA